LNGFTDQIPFAPKEFAANPEPRCPCLLLLDTSGSMGGAPINELNEGLVVLNDELMADSMVTNRVELAIVTFGPVYVETDFQTVDAFVPPTLRAHGDTPMGAAIEHGLEMLRHRKETYKASGISYFRPWIFMITDGGPTDAWQNAARLVREGEESKSFMFFGVGVQNANMEILGKITSRAPLHLKGLRYRDLFSWLSNSLGSVSHSNPGDQVPVNNPASPEGWATVG
jgi:uncharacterized protein YegL